MSDLETYVQEVLAKPGGTLPPLPVLKPYERYLYQSAEAGRRDPFVQSRKEAAAIAQTDNSLERRYQQECQIRNREDLENFELDSLRMVGTLGKSPSQPEWAIVLDPTGKAHRVRIGNYVGRNCGKIKNIREDRIEIVENVQESGPRESARFVGRKANLALSGGE
jgi:type IV pilus assembly protein PilP